MNTSKRVLINSIVLYIKTVFTVVISIIYSRYLLIALGFEDYGIYNLVGGIIGLLSFITSTLSNSGIRFIARTLGENDNENTLSILHTIFYVTNRIIWLIALSLELSGIILINYILNIPSNRLFAANFVYQFMIINAIYELSTAPYLGILIAREKFIIISILEIVKAFFILFITLSLKFMSTDKLILYGGFLMILSIMNRIILKNYCRKSESELLLIRNYNSAPDKNLIRAILSFSGWNLLESLGIIINRQGTIFLINLFFGVAMNAALGLAYTVNNQLSNVSSSLLRAIQPQLFKSFGEDNKIKIKLLTFSSSKLGTILLFYALAPLYSEVDYVLKIWLKEIPDYTSIFIRLFFVLTLIGHMSYGLTIALQGHGRIKEIQIVNLTLKSLSIIIGYLLFKNEFQAYSIVVATIILEAILLTIKFPLAKRFIALDLKGYVSEVIFKPVVLLINLFVINTLIIHLINMSFLRLSIILLLDWTIISIYSYFFFLSEYEKQLVQSFINSIKFKIISRKI